MPSCLTAAYIDLNAVRAGIVVKPEDYRWCSLAYHIQANNRDNLLSLDFGLREFGVLNDTERLRRYRRFVYENGGIKKQSKVPIHEKHVDKERARNFEISNLDRFRYRTRYFTDSGVIGSKAFVEKQLKKLKNLHSIHTNRKPKKVSGLNNVYSLKRLTE